MVRKAIESVKIADRAIRFQKMERKFDRIEKMSEKTIKYEKKELSLKHIVEKTYSN